MSGFEGGEVGRSILWRPIWILESFGRGTISRSLGAELVSDLACLLHFESVLEDDSLLPRARGMDMFYRVELRGVRTVT